MKIICFNTNINCCQPISSNCYDVIYFDLGWLGSKRALHFDKEAGAAHSKVSHQAWRRGHHHLHELLHPWPFDPTWRLGTCSKEKWGRSRGPSWWVLSQDDHKGGNDNLKLAYYSKTWNMNSFKLDSILDAYTTVIYNVCHGFALHNLFTCKFE